MGQIDQNIFRNINNLETDGHDMMCSYYWNLDYEKGGKSLKLHLIFKIEQKEDLVDHKLNVGQTYRKNSKRII